MIKTSIDLYIVNSTFPLILSIENIYRKKNKNYKILFLKNNTHQSLENYIKKKFNKEEITFFSNSYLGQIHLIIISFWYNIFFNIQNLYAGTISQKSLKLIFNYFFTKSKIILSDGTDSISFYWSGKRFEELHNKPVKKLDLISIFNLNGNLCNNQKINLNYYSSKKKLIADSLLILGGRYLVYRDKNEIFSILEQIINHHKKNYGIKNFYYKPHPYEYNSTILKKIFAKFNFLNFYGENNGLPIELDYKNALDFPMYITSDNLMPTTSFFTLTDINSLIISNIIEVKDEKFINNIYLEEYNDIMNYIYSAKNKNFKFIKILQ